MKVRRGVLCPDMPRYLQLEVEVPPGAPALSVELSYDRSAGVVDLGVFDPGGFRGYSGGARSGFVITPSGATPGYLPGELPAGTWLVLLGLHRIPRRGLPYELTVSTGPADPPPPPPAPAPGPRPAPRRLPAAPGRRWVAADLHCHTHHSDGDLSVEQLADLARRVGLEALAVSDHNTVSHHPALAAAGARYGVTLLPAQEVTAPWGHANCLGDVGWVDFRLPPRLWLEHARARGGLLSVNHPAGPDQHWEHPLRTGMVEVWHGGWDRLSPDPLDFWERVGGVPVGGSDFHGPGRRDLGHPTTWVEAGEDGILEGLRAGRVALSWGPRGPVVLRRGDAVEVLDGEGATLVLPGGRTRPVRSGRERIDAEPGPLRLVEPDRGRLLALSP